MGGEDEFRRWVREQFDSRETDLNFWRTSKAKRVNVKSLVSRLARFYTQFKEKESLNLLLVMDSLRFLLALKVKKTRR